MNRPVLGIVSSVCCCVTALWLGTAAAASAAPLVITYEDHYAATRTMAISNNFTLIPSQPVINAILELPRFDPLLGELLSVGLRIEGEIWGQLNTHCEGPISCNTSAGGVVGSGLNLAGTTAVLGVDLGADVTVTAFGERNCSFTTFPVADCSRQWNGHDTDFRSLSFSGADVAGFEGTLPFHFVQNSIPSVYMSLSHEGFPNSAPGGPGDVDAAQVSASLPGINDILDLFYQLYLNDVFANHSFAFSDAHLPRTSAALGVGHLHL